MNHTNSLATRSPRTAWDAVSAPTARSLRPSGDGQVVAMPRRRLRLGAVGMDIHRFSRPRPIQLTVKPATVLLVLALEGRAELVGETQRTMVDETQALLLARPGCSTLMWAAGSHGVVFHFPRNRLQMLISRDLGTPMRLATAEVALPLKSSEPLVDLAIRLGAAPGDDHEADRSEQLDIALTRLLTAHPERDGFLSVARSIQRAVQHVRDSAETDLNPRVLAAASGVVSRTLQEGFRACLGVSVKRFVQQAHLNRARERLASGHDSRPISEVALAAGFRSSSAFSRAYAQAFSETPSRTRAEGVQKLS